MLDAQARQFERSAGSSGPATDDDDRIVPLPVTTRAWG